MTNYASQAAARSPKFKCHGKRHAPWERVQGRPRDMSKEARPKSCCSILVMESTNKKWVMSKEVCQQSYGRRMMFKPFLMSLERTWSHLRRTAFNELVLTEFKSITRVLAMVVQVKRRIHVTDEESERSEEEEKSTK